MSTEPTHQVNGNGNGNGAKPQTPWLRDLLADLNVGIGREMQTTLSVAVCTAAKMPRSEMIMRLGITETEAKMAALRLGSVIGEPQ